MNLFNNHVLYIGQKSLNDLNSTYISNNYSSVSILVDENTNKFCLPILEKYIKINNVFILKSGENNKTINTCIDIWQQLSSANIDRKALVINLGGGVICDIGGFIASTFKRGIDFVNIPTTLLSMCDAAVGGKVAVNNNGIKNEIGLFSNPIAIYIYPDFLKTLPKRHKLSGFAEIIKHALIGDKKLFNKIVTNSNVSEINDELISHSIKIKKRIVKLDPLEKNIRKALNFGHSVGHALETFNNKNEDGEPISHGEAIAVGIITESYISFLKKHISESELNQITKFILLHYKKIKIYKKNFPEIIKLIEHDKKNEKSVKLFTLLDGIGNFRINEPVTSENIISSLDFYNNL